MRLVFAWDEWNRQHVRKHGSAETDAKFVIENVEHPFPREIGDGKLLIWGKTASDAFLEVVFTFKAPEDLRFASLEFLDWVALIDYHGTVAIYIIHAMPMTGRQIRQYRKLRKES